MTLVLPILIAISAEQLEWVYWQVRQLTWAVYSPPLAARCALDTTAQTFDYTRDSTWPQVLQNWFVEFDLDSGQFTIVFYKLMDIHSINVPNTLSYCFSTTHMFEVRLKDSVEIGDKLFNSHERSKVTKVLSLVNKVLKLNFNSLCF